MIFYFINQEFGYIMGWKLPQPVNKEEFDVLLGESKKILDSYWMPRKEIYTPRGKIIRQYVIAMILAFGAGMRISEIVGLKKVYKYKYKGEERTQICNVPELTPDKIENNFIRVVGAKGGKDRQVPLPVKLFKKAGITRKEFLENLPLKVSRSAIQKFTSEIGTEFLKKDISFHKLRHGFATFMLESRIDLHELQRLMGHSRLDTTGIYLHANPKKTMEKYETIEW